MAYMAQRILRSLRSWLPQRAVTTVILAVLFLVVMPAILALGLLARQNLGRHRSEMEAALHEQYARNLSTVDRSLANRLAEMEASIKQLLRPTPASGLGGELADTTETEFDDELAEELAISTSESEGFAESAQIPFGTNPSPQGVLNVGSLALRAASLANHTDLPVWVDILDAKGEALAMTDPADLAALTRQANMDAWRHAAEIAELALKGGRFDEASAWYKILADTRPQRPVCNIPRGDDPVVSSLIHLAGVLGQLRVALAASDATASANRARHLWQYHLITVPPSVVAAVRAITDPTPTNPLGPATGLAALPELGRGRDLLVAWFSRLADPIRREELRQRLKAVGEARGSAGLVARMALTETLDWGRAFQTTRTTELWHQAARNLIEGGLPAQTTERFIRLAHPDLGFVGVTRLRDGRYLTYRIDQPRWWSHMAWLLTDQPSESRVELLDATGRHLAGLPPSRQVPSLMLSHNLRAVPGWTLTIGPADPLRLTAAAERVDSFSLALTVVALFSVVTGVGFLLVNYVRQTQLNQLQAGFVSGVSHELRTPLASVRMAAETLWMGRYRTVEEARELHRRIVLETDRLARMVADVLDFSRLERDLWPLNFAPVDLPELVADVVVHFQPNLESASAELRISQTLEPPLQESCSTPPLVPTGSSGPTEAPAPHSLGLTPGETAPPTTPPMSETLGSWQGCNSQGQTSSSVEPSLASTVLPLSGKWKPKLPLVWADAQALRQVVINLVDNALRYSPPPARIEIDAESEGSVVRLSVSDQGIGMTREVRHRVFEKFYRGPSPEVQRHRGTGLGLAFVAEILRRHGGNVSADSQPGCGSTFTIRIPVCQTNSNDLSRP